MNVEFETSEKECFLRNVFLFYQNRERILADKRMANAVVPVHLGTWGLSIRQLTLGGYLRWWSEGVQGIVETKDGKVGLIYFVNGSPLSGSCIKRFVTEDGRDERITSSGFLSCLKSLFDAQKLCQDEGENVSPMSLQEVADQLRAEYADKSSCEQKLRIETLELRVRLLRNELEAARKYSRLQSNELYLTRLLWKETELIELHRKRQEYKSQFDKELEELRSRCRELKSLHKKGELYDKTFQKSYMACRKREREIAADIRNFDDVEFSRIWPWNTWSMNLDEMIADLRINNNLTHTKENGNLDNQENG